MSRVDLNDATWANGVIVTSDEATIALDATVQELLTAAVAANRQLPLKKIDVQTGGANQPITYTVTLVDKRVWSQKIQNTRVPDPGMTFDVPAYWKEWEFGLLRPIRSAVVLLLATHSVQTIVLEPRQSAATLAAALAVSPELAQAQGGPNA